MNETVNTLTKNSNIEPTSYGRFSELWSLFGYPKEEGPPENRKLKRNPN